MPTSKESNSQKQIEKGICNLYYSVINGVVS